MSESFYHKNSQLLQKLMQEVDISSIKELSSISGVSQWQLNRLLYGLMPKMQIETLLKISEALQVSLNQLLKIFLPESISPLTVKSETTSEKLESLKQEYQLLQQQMAQQRETLNEEFQQSSLQVLESWLLQWPTAAAAAKKKSQLPAVKLLPLLKPVENLLTQWGVEAIASVGEQIPYDPQWHQLMEGDAKPGDNVRVRYVGYKQGDKLLHRAKVSP